MITSLNLDSNQLLHSQQQDMLRSNENRNDIGSKTIFSLEKWLWKGTRTSPFFDQKIFGQKIIDLSNYHQYKESNRLFEIADITSSIQGLVLKNSFLPEKSLLEGLRRLQTTSPDLEALLLDQPMRTEAFREILALFPNLKKLEWGRSIFNFYKENPVLANELMSVIINWMTGNPFLISINAGWITSSEQFAQFNKYLPLSVKELGLHVLIDSNEYESVLNLSTTHGTQLGSLIFEQAHRINLKVLEDLPKLFPNLTYVFPMGVETNPFIISNVYNEWPENQLTALNFSSSSINGLACDKILQQFPVDTIVIGDVKWSYVDLQKIVPTLVQQNKIRKIVFPYDLNFENNPKEVEPLLKSMEKLIPNLEELSGLNWNSLNTKTLLFLANSVSEKLRRLELRGWKTPDHIWYDSIVKEAFLIFGKNCTQISHLALRNIDLKHVSKDTLLKIASTFHDLEKLDLKDIGSYRRSSDYIDMILQFIDNNILLRSINVSGTLTGADVKALEARSVKVKKREVNILLNNI